MPQAYAALWCGSAARGEGREGSDLDFHVLVSGDERWRSSFVVDGVPVEVFHNPTRKVRAMFAAGDAASLAMFAEGRPVWPHPELTELQAEAQRSYAAGRPPQPLTAFARHTLVDAVMDTRAEVGQPVHSFLIMAALGRHVMQPLYAQRGWWDVKPQRWLSDLESKAPELAAELRACLDAQSDAARQAAFEALALRLTGDFEYHAWEGERQPVP